MHADRLLGRDPLMGRVCLGTFPTMVCTCRVSTLYARVPCEWGFSFLVLEVWLENHLSSPSIIVWGPRPEASTPLSCRLFHGRSYPWVSWGDTLLAQAHSWYQTRSTPEASQRLRPVNSLAYFISAPDGSHYVDFDQRPRTNRYNYDKHKDHKRDTLLILVSSLLFLVLLHIG